MKKKLIIILSILSIIAIILGLVFRKKVIDEKYKDFEILDTTYICAEALEPFYEDKEYIYSFPCIQSSYIYVKYPNGNKFLLVDELNDGNITIDDAIKNGLKVIKEKK